MECFTVMSNEIEGRLDPFYYKPEFRELKRILLSKKIEKLGDIASFQYGLNETAKEKGDIFYIRITDIDEEGLLKKDEIAYLNYKPEYSNYKLTKGDILIARIGATFGKSFYFNENLEAVFAGYLIRIKLKDKKVNPKFLFYFFQTKYFKNQAKMLVKGGAQPQFNANTIKDLLIPILSLETQNRIVALMDKAYQSKKSKEAEAQKLLDSINDYVLDELGIKMPELKDKMVYVVNSDDVKGKRIDAYYYQPKFEEVEKAIKRGKYEVRELKEFITKIHYGASVKNEYVNEGIPLLRIMNLKPNKFDLKDIVKLPETMKKDLGNAFVKEGDLLISRSGTVGMVSVVPKEAEGFAFGSFMIKFCLNDKINKNYISAWLNTKLQKLLTEREKIGAIQGNITIETIENFKIPLPPLSIQNKIADEVKRRIQKAEQLQKEAKEELEKAKQEVEKIILG
ncbi:MAG: restriction endonuclease subunit S [Candidatus Pacearchaeota archaeon]